MSFTKATEALLNAVNKTFGTTATYTYASDSTTTEVKGVFNNDFVEVQGIVTRAPSFRMKLSDLTDEPTETDTITINSIIYVVREHQPDSHGATTIILERQ